MPHDNKNQPFDTAPPPLSSPTHSAHATSHIHPAQAHALQSNTDSRLSILTEEEEKRLVVYNHITYLLYLLSFFTAGLTWIVPIFMNYLKRKEARNSWLASHFDWQIKTFWYSIVIAVIGIVIMLFGFGVLGVSIFAESGHAAAGSVVLSFIGGALVMFAVLWHLYRIVRGWIALSDGRAV